MEYSRHHYLYFWRVLLSLFHQTNHQQRDEAEVHDLLGHVFAYSILIFFDYASLTQHVEQGQISRAEKDWRDMAPFLQPSRQHLRLLLLCGQRDPVDNALPGYRLLINKEAIKQAEAG